MKRIIFAMLFVCGLAPMAQADIQPFGDEINNVENSWIRPGPPGRRPDPYPGPGYPPDRPGRPPGPGRPHPPHNPNPPPYRIEYITCSSWNYQYNECYFHPWGVQQVRLNSRHTYDPCIWGRTAGAYGDRVWVSNGCQATFEIIRY
ncbi:DUF3011 domain-containing protein [Bdellovibrio reynosensis]|uniref:DUF3011 domain-containing protein n=1 Tax=Bdellovibrio reynosensis TaxID=2835041 RepID=A0ABY4C4J7_9BACT|nr:DUF3011 domain-containing protein [Bdellovibrio reynosensis]UOE99748.1 DUF3011 domain-containing protein [Bdellovibrio reynosensis]